MTILHFEHLEVGTVFWGDEVTVDREEMIAFAERFDPQPMHMTDSDAQAIGLDAVIASGSFTWALVTLSMQGMVRDRLALLPGGLRIEISFTAPVYAGDRLQLRAQIADLRVSSKGGRGFVRMSEQFVNQSDVAAMEIEATWVIATRE